MNTYNKTKYPEIFKNTCWGRATGVDQEIIENRNEFAFRFNIQPFSGFPPQYVRKYISYNCNTGRMDHIEIFKSRFRFYIILSSPYSDCPHQHHVEKGWAPYYKKLYLSNAYTYINFVSMETQKSITYSSFFKKIEHPPKNECPCSRDHLDLTEEEYKQIPIFAEDTEEELLFAEAWAKKNGFEWKN